MLVSRRTIASSLFTATVSALVAGTALAATWAPTVIPSTAKPGDEITVTISAFGGPANYGTDLYIVRSSAYADELNCPDMSGSVKVGAIVWTVDGLKHEGAAQFTVPDLAAGEYTLGVDMVLWGCFLSGTLTVDAGISNTAIRPGQKPLILWLMIAGIVLAGVVRGIARRRHM
jgi:hypothetical protein